MKKIFMLLAICLYCVYINAQPANLQPGNRHKAGDKMFKPARSLRLSNRPDHQAKLSVKNYDPVTKYRLDSIIIKYDEMLTGNYTNGEKGFYFYDENFHLVSTLQQSWNGAWIDYWKDDFYYNQMGLSDSVISYEYTGGHWQQAFKEKRTYNPDSTLLCETYYNWDWTTFIPSQKIEYVYNSGTIVENWFTYENGWINDYIVTYYLTNGSITSELCKSIYATGHMQNDYKADYLYYANGDLQDRMLSYWEGSAWTIPIEKESYVYDEYNNIELYTWSMLNEDGLWDVFDEYLPEYNNQFTLNDLIIPAGMDDEIYFRHMLTRRVDNSYDVGELAFTVEINPYYTPLIVEKAKNLTVNYSTAYPNPATDNITIGWSSPVKTARITFYNTAGLTEFSSDIRNNSIIPTTALNPGLHLYKLTDNGVLIGTGKVVVR